MIDMTTIANEVSNFLAKISHKKIINQKGIILQFSYQQQTNIFKSNEIMFRETYVQIKSSQRS